jgi:hypothetical protein
MKSILMNIYTRKTKYKIRKETTLLTLTKIKKATITTTTTIIILITLLNNTDKTNFTMKMKLTITKEEIRSHLH